MDCGITMVYSCLGVTGTLLMATGLLSVRSQGVRVSQVFTGPRDVTWRRGSWPQLSTPPFFISWLCLLTDYLAGLSYPLSLRTPYSWCHLPDLRRQAALIVLPIMQLCPPCFWWIRAGLCHSQILSPCCYYEAPLWNSTSWFQPWPLEDDLHWHLRDAGVLSSVLFSPALLRIPVGWWLLDLYWRPTPASVLLWRVWSLTPLQYCGAIHSDTDRSEQCGLHCLRAKLSTKLCSNPAVAPCLEFSGIPHLEPTLFGVLRIHSGWIFGRKTHRTQASAVPMITVFL